MFNTSCLSNGLLSIKLQYYFNENKMNNNRNILQRFFYVPQGGILSPVLYNIYASGQPTSPHTLIIDYAGDKAIIISVNSDDVTASGNLQHHLFLTENWYLHKIEVFFTGCKVCITSRNKYRDYGKMY